jgi:hypothetical protein
MTTVIINEKTKAGRSLVEFLRQSKQAQIIEENRPISSLLKSIKEAEKGKVIRANNVNDLLAKLKE